jgi:hypothetical protein
MLLDSPLRAEAVPLIRTLCPVPPGSVFVPARVQWYSVLSLSRRRSSISTSMSGKASTKDLAAAVIAARPTDGTPSLIVSEPSDP